MLGLVTRDWWVFAIRGIAALVFGILAFIWPETTLTVLVFLFGAYVLVDGVALLVALVRGDRSRGVTPGPWGSLASSASSPASSPSHGRA